jgi:hypothetical protein
MDDVWVDYTGFFPTQSVTTAWEVAASHAKRFNLAATRQQETEIIFGAYPQPLLALRRHESDWSYFGVFGIRPEFLEASGTGEVVSWLLTLSDELRCCFARTYSEATMPTHEETVQGPDCLDWLQYFSPDVARKWSLPFLQEGPFHNVVGFPSGGVGIQLGPWPFQPWMSVRAAADYLGLRLRPRMGTNYHGQRVERQWH